MCDLLATSGLLVTVCGSFFWQLLQTSFGSFVGARKSVLPLSSALPSSELLIMEGSPRKKSLRDQASSRTGTSHDQPSRLLRSPYVYVCVNEFHRVRLVSVSDLESHD